MQYLTIPATITPERHIPVFHFEELPAEVQEELIAKRADNPEWDYFSERTQEDVELDISQYWVPEKLEPIGWSLPITSYSCGGIIPEYEVNWSYDYSWSVWFTATVDLERFILSQKLGRKYQLALSAARSGEVYSASVGQNTSRSYGHNPGDIEATIELDIPWSDLSDNQTSRAANRMAKLEKQCLELETILAETYETLTGEMEKAFSGQQEYYGSEEYYRDILTEIDADILYTISGEEVSL